MQNFKLEQFEGPLDLLLKLIEEEKMDVTRVSLARVADQYLEYISQNSGTSLESLAAFLTVASRLLLIKSKALLPLLEFSDEEEKEIMDLEWQLAEYKKFKEISRQIARLYGSQAQGFTREGYQGFASLFYPPENLNAHDIKQAFLKVLSEIPILEKIEEEVVREIVTLEDKIEHLRVTLQTKMETSFSEIISQAQDKIEVIVSFLAMLELVKQRMIEVEQSEIFQEIRLKVNNPSSTPVQ